MESWLIDNVFSHVSQSMAKEITFEKCDASFEGFDMALATDNPGWWSSDKYALGSGMKAVGTCRLLAITLNGRETKD